MGNVINSINISGRLTADAESNELRSGSTVTKFSIATDKRIKDDAGEWKNEPMYFDVETWDKYTAALVKELVKGRSVSISGKLEQQRWTADDGSNRSKVIIKADNIVLGELPRGSAQAPKKDKPLYDEDVPF